jgi:MFS family permease
MPSWKRTFWAVWVANLITAIGMMAFLPFFASHVEDLGLRDEHEIAIWAGVLFGAAPFSAAFASPLWGALGDRFGRRLMVLRSMLGITIFVGAMAYARNPWELFALRIAQGLFSGFIAPSMTLVSTLAPADQQSRVSSALNTAMVLGGILGPVLGESLRAQVGIRNVYLVVAALAGVSAVLVWLFAREDHSKRRTEQRATRWSTLLSETVADLHGLRSNQVLRAALVLTFLIQFGLGATYPLLELFVRHVPAHLVWPEPSQWWLTWLQPNVALLFSSMAVATLVATPWWGAYGDRLGAYRALLRCAGWTALALLLQAFAPDYEVLLVARVCFGAAMAGSSPLAFGVAAAESTHEQRGGAIGIVFAARTLSVAVASMVGGWASTYLGVRGLFAVSAAIVLAYLLWLRRARVREAADTAAGAA